MLQYSAYSVISARRAARRSSGRAPTRRKLAAEAMGITAERLTSSGSSTKSCREPLGGAHRDPQATADVPEGRAAQVPRQVEVLTADQLVERYARLRGRASMPADEGGGLQSWAAAACARGVPRGTLATRRLPVSRALSGGLDSTVLLCAGAAAGCRRPVAAARGPRRSRPARRLEVVVRRMRDALAAAESIPVRVPGVDARGVR